MVPQNDHRHGDHEGVAPSHGAFDGIAQLEREPSVGHDGAKASTTRRAPAGDRAARRAAASSRDDDAEASPLELKTRPSAMTIRTGSAASSIDFAARLTSPLAMSRICLERRSTGPPRKLPASTSCASTWTRWSAIVPVDHFRQSLARIGDRERRVGLATAGDQWCDGDQAHQRDGPSIHHVTPSVQRDSWSEDTFADVAEHGRRGFGGDEGTRTPDPRDANAVLFQLSYIPTGGRATSADGGPVRNGSTRAAGAPIVLTGATSGVCGTRLGSADALRTPDRPRCRPVLGHDGHRQRARQPAHRQPAG